MKPFPLGPLQPLRTRLAGWLQTGRQRWRHGAERFDSFSLRERALMVAAGVAAAWMLADLLWLTPAWQAYKQARQQHRTVQAALLTQAAEAERQAAMDRAQAQQAQADLAQWRQRVRQGEADLRAHEATLVGPDRMLPLLQELLAGHGRVRVRALRVLPRVDLLANTANTNTTTNTAEAAAVAASGPLPGAVAAGSGLKHAPSLYQHGVELTLEGSYADLLDYLRALEALPQRLLWGGLQLRVEKHPTTVMTLRLHTLSLERHWLEI
jgi:MSHA biogenesis protein MshJ